MARAGVLDRDRLEEAANAYFAQLVREVDQPRNLPADDFDNALAIQIEHTEAELASAHGGSRTRTTSISAANSTSATS